VNAFADIFSLSGKTALVAGASRGIGLAIAQALAAHGAHTVLAARSMDKLEAVAKELPNARALHLDLTHFGALGRMAEWEGGLNALLKKRQR